MAAMKAIVAGGTDPISGRDRGDVVVLEMQNVVVEGLELHER